MYYQVATVSGWTAEKSAAKFCKLQAIREDKGKIRRREVLMTGGPEAIRPLYWNVQTLEGVDFLFQSFLKFGRDCVYAEDLVL